MIKQLLLITIIFSSLVCTSVSAADKPKPMEPLVQITNSNTSGIGTLRDGTGKVLLKNGETGIFKIDSKVGLLLNHFMITQWIDTQRVEHVAMKDCQVTFEVDPIMKWYTISNLNGCTRQGGFTIAKKPNGQGNIPALIVSFGTSDD